MDSMNESSGHSLNPWILSFLVLLPYVSAVVAYMGLHNVSLSIFLVAGLSAFVVFFRRNGDFDDRIIMILIWSISLSLILSSTLASDNLRGYDIYWEYLVAVQTAVTGVWNVQYFTLASVLSVTILPAVISSLSALNMEQIFKFVYPIVFSLVPVILYRITRKILAPPGAFLSVFLFMSYVTFYDGMLGLARQEIAEVLLVLLVLVLLSPELSKGISGKLSLILLMVGFAVSHYSLFYIFAVILAYSCLTSRAFRRTEGLMLLSLMVVFGLVWYTYAGRGASVIGLGSNISSVITSINGFFSSSSRPTEVMKAIGTAPLSYGPLQQVNRWTQILVQLCLLLGFFVLAFKKKGAWEQEIFPLMTGGLIILGSSIILPGLAATLNLTRIYQIALLFIAPFFIYGVERVELALRGVGSRLQVRRYPLLHSATQRTTLHLAAAILFLYFLFVSGWFTAVTAGAPTSYVLDGNRMRNSTNPSVSALYYGDFTVLPDISGAVWLRTYDVGGRSVCADVIARNAVLQSYGEFPVTPNYLSQGVYTCGVSKSMIYLSEFNNIHGLVFTYSEPFPMSDISPTLSTMNRVYSNGGTTIYA